MEKLPMCRICLVENVRMYVVVNKNLHALYEKLTDFPFVTGDSRPILACFFCCTKLKQCYQLLKKCLQAEELFAQMINEDYEPNPLINPCYLEFFCGFIKTPIEHISIDECQTKSVAIKEQSPAVSERLNNINEPKEKHQSDELEPEDLENSYTEVEDTPPHQSESDSEDDVPLMEFKTAVKDDQESLGSTVAKKPKLYTRKTKLEDTLTAKQKTHKRSHSRIIRNSQDSTSRPVTEIKERFTNTKPGVNNSISSINNSKKDNLRLKKRYKCEICQNSFSQKISLIRHIRKHTGEKPFKCDICQRSFIGKSNLISHIRIHTGEKPFKCDICQNSFSQKISLISHIRIHTGEKPFKCDICQNSFSQKISLIRHIRKHTGEKPFKCDICQRSFIGKSNLINHIRIHTGEKPFKCDICQRSFTAKSNLISHIRIHTGEKPFKCDICQRSFIGKSNLISHIRIHTGEKPFKCDICQRSFIDKCKLTTHIRIHTGEKPFKCKICQRSFIDNSNFTSHSRIHTGEKPFNCDICQRSFTHKNSLTRHSRVHTGAKPYKCVICQRSFSHKHSLTRHICTHR